MNFPRGNAVNGFFRKINIELLTRIYVYVNLFYVLFSFEVVFADPFKYQYRSARFLGRGDAGIASVNGGDAMFYNPAGIAQGGNSLFRELYLISPQIEVSDNAKQAYDKKGDGDTALLNYVIANKNVPFYAGLQNLTAIIFKNIAFGAMQRGDGAVQLIVDPSTGMPSTQASANIWNGGYISMAQDFFSGHVLMGLTGKYVQKREFNLNLTALQLDSQLQNNSISQDFKNSERRGSAIGADFGSMFIFDKESETQVGVVFRNLGMNYSWVIPANGIAPSADPIQLDFGASTSFGTKKGRVKLLADYRDIFNIQNQHYSKHTHFGMEYNLVNTFYVMAGFNQGYLSYGLGLSLKIIRIEGGSYIEEMGERPGQTPSTRYFARISLGWLL